MLYCLSTRSFVVWSWLDDAQSFRLKKRCWFDHELRAIIDKKKEKKNEKKSEADLIIDSKLSIEEKMLIWSLTQSYRIDEKEKENWDNWSIELSLEDSSNVETHSFEMFLFNTLNLLMLCLVILTSRHEHWESNFEINLVLLMKATFNTDKDIKLARALLTRVMIIFRDQLVQLLVWLNNKRRWCNSKKKD